MKPILRFANFDNDWEEIELLKIASEISYGMNAASKEYDGENKYIRITDIDEQTNKYIHKNIVSPDGNLEEKFLVKENDILFARTGASTGKTYLYDKNDGKLYYAGFLIKANIINHNANFIFQQTKLNKYNSWVKIMSMRSGQPGINSQEYGSYKFSITNPEEENKVSNFLSLLDKKIELQSQKIEDLKLFKLYTENSLLNSSSSIHWKKLKLNDILVEGNKEPVKNTNDFKKITIKLNLNGLEFNESKREMSDKRPFYIREENEIIIGKQNYFNGSIAIVTKEFSGCICSNAIMSFKVKEGYNLNYIYLYLSQKRYMKEREFLANGTGQKELSEKEFLKFTIKVPEDSVVNNITTIIDKINKKINFENNKLNKLIELKKGLMQNMFV